MSSPEAAARQASHPPSAAPQPTTEPNPPANRTLTPVDASRRARWPDLPARVAPFKRAGLDADQVVAVLLHRGEIDPHGAGRARQLFAAAPTPPGGAS